MVHGGNSRTPRVTRTLRFLLNVGFFFFMPALLLSQEQKLSSARLRPTPLLLPPDCALIPKENSLI